MALSLDDLVVLSGKSNATEEQFASAKITSEAIDAYIGASGDTLVRPHQVASSGEPGGLTAIGQTEQLRTFGHGEPGGGSGAMVRVGGYDPAELVALLIQIGLPRDYMGEIYLSGCATAAGLNHGFIGTFYANICSHYPGITVRGNLGISKTLADGTSAVSKGTMPDDEIERQLHVFRQERKRLGQRRDDLALAIATLRCRPADADAERAARLDEAFQASEALDRESHALNLRVLDFDRLAFDTTGKRTVVLPSDEVAGLNAVDAIAFGLVHRTEDIAALLQRINASNQSAVREHLLKITREPSAQLPELVERTSRLASATQDLNLPQL